MTVAELNHILNIGNALSIVSRAALMLYLAWFLTTEFVEQAPRTSESMIVPYYVRKWAICLGFSIFLWALGAEIITVGVQFWRVAGRMIGFWLMLIGEGVAIAGNLLLLRTLSVKRWGEIVWLIVAALVVLTAVLMMLHAL